MRHTCSDGQTARLVRDASAPVGTYAMMSCPRCGWTRHGAVIRDDAARILFSPFVRRALASELPAKEYGR